MFRRPVVVELKRAGNCPVTRRISVNVIRTGSNKTVGELVAGPRVKVSV